MGTKIKLEIDSSENLEKAVVLLKYKDKEQIEVSEVKINENNPQPKKTEKTFVKKGIADEFKTTY